MYWHLKRKIAQVDLLNYEQSHSYVVYPKSLNK